MADPSMWAFLFSLHRSLHQARRSHAQLAIPDIHFCACPVQAKLFLTFCVSCYIVWPMKYTPEPQPELEYEVGYVRQLHDAIVNEDRRIAGKVRGGHRKSSSKPPKVRKRQSDEAYKNFRVAPVERDSTYMGSCAPTTRSTARHVAYQPTPKSVAFEDELRLRKFLRDNLRPQDRAILERLDYYLQPLCERAQRIKEATK